MWRWSGEQNRPSADHAERSLPRPADDPRQHAGLKRVGNVRNNSRDLAEPVIEQDLLL
jgi:hypothetical protein